MPKRLIRPRALRQNPCIAGARGRKTPRQVPLPSPRFQHVAGPGGHGSEDRTVRASEVRQVASRGRRRRPATPAGRSYRARPAQALQKPPCSWGVRGSDFPASSTSNPGVVGHRERTISNDGVRRHAADDDGAAARPRDQPLPGRGRAVDASQTADGRHGRDQKCPAETPGPGALNASSAKNIPITEIDARHQYRGQDETGRQHRQHGRQRQYRKGARQAEQNRRRWTTPRHGHGGSGKKPASCTHQE